jgi:DNA-binding CsgD family transcriptional regulator
MEAHVPTTPDRAGAQAKPALIALVVASIGLLFVAELNAPPDVPLGAVVLIPVLVSCLFLDHRWSAAVLGLAILTRVAVATVGDTSMDLAALEVASYVATLAIALASTRRVAFVAAQTHLDEVGPARPVPNLAPPSLAAAGLTDRERQVLDMAIHGLTAKQIGERLYIGRRTVETHLGRAYGKLGARNKRELIARSFDDPQRTAVPLAADSERAESVSLRVSNP